MKIVLQRVNSASVSVNNMDVGSIQKGYVAFLGIANGDDEQTVKKAVDKIFRLRIFADSNGKTNLSALDVDGQILVISQFTLMADLSSNRPSFSKAASPDRAQQLYNLFLQECSKKFKAVSSGVFASHMHVCADNDGPFTIVLDL